jgi:hypothetical protein
MESTAERTTIKEIVPRLNGSIYIPCLQRDYCWKQKQIQMLWDSLLRGLPLGSLLIWEDDNDGERDDPAYDFIKRYVDERAYPSDDGPRRYSQRVSEDSLPQHYSLVLDGQQRLTSFYIGLLGSFTTRTHGGWRSNPDAWNERELHFDLLSGQSAADHDRDLVYDFDFRKQEGLSESAESYWWPVSRLVVDSASLSTDDFLSKDELVGRELDELRDKVDDTQVPKVESNLSQIWWGVNERQSILYESTFTDEKTARELFIRRNKAGEELSGVDILLALLTGYWKTVDDAGSPTDAKKEIEQFTETLSSIERFTDQGFTFGKRFTLRALLLLSGERPTFRKDGRYDGDRLREAERIFRDDAFEQAIKDAFSVSIDLGFHNAALSSKTIVLPVVQHYYENDVRPSDEVRESIHYWLSTIVLNSVSGNVGSQRVLETARDHIQETGSAVFPAKRILGDLQGSGAVTRLDADRLDELLDEVDYNSGSRRNALLTHLYEDRRAGQNDFEVDHIHPRGKLGDTEYLVENGVPAEESDWFEEHRDHFANLQLLTGGKGGENQSKGDSDLSKWLKKVADGEVDGLSSKEEYFELHRVPSEPELHQYRNFPKFIDREGREGLIRDRLRETLPLIETDD